MSGTQMHADEVMTDPAMVGRLVGEQFPQWADLAVVPVSSAGTDNAIYRLGDDLAVRLPRLPSAAGQLDVEYRHLPGLAPHLPLEIPAPLRLGRANDEYPFAWAVYRWLHGDDARSAPPTDLALAALDLGRFVRALRACDPADAPVAYRAEPMDSRDKRTRESLDTLRTIDDHTDDTRGLDLDALLSIWRAALQEPPAAPVWIHGDLTPANLIVRDGRITAVIDFGCGGLGDPAWDLLPAWAVFGPDTRQVFRDTAGLDERAWTRARGIATSWALIALPYYRHTNLMLAGMARATLDEVLRDR